MVDDIERKFVSGKDSGVFYPDTPVESWCMIYRLRVVEDQCPRCRRLRIADIPVFFKGFRGLISVEHNCGPGFRLLSVRAWGEQVHCWRDVLN